MIFGNSISQWFKQKNRWLMLVGASLAVCAWTFIRLFDRPLNFDLVGQQILAHQWAQGLHTGASIGPTNYILKMLFLYTPFGWLHLSAWTNLIALTLLINLATLILSAWLCCGS